MLRMIFQEIHSNYLKQKKQPFADNWLATKFRKTYPAELKKIVKNDNLLIKGSPGQSQWAHSPWLAIFNKNITHRAEIGYYLAYLFSDDLKRVYLCQAQGAQSIKKNYKKNYRNELRNRASIILDKVPEYKNNFVAGRPNLTAKNQLPKDYENTVAYYKQYDLANLPSEDTLLDNLEESIDLYEKLYFRGGVYPLSEYIQGFLTDEERYKYEQLKKEDPSAALIEKKTYVAHNVIDRNATVSKEVKEIHGYSCQVCGINFQKIYGDIGEGYIEAHHLIPLHTLADNETMEMNLKNDFAVLCSNCHRMVHRKRKVLTLEEIKKLPGVRELRKYYESK